ncbi:TPA: hypothetical protein ACH3X2_007043 [Trebouxia sp. C0005]
MVINGFSLIDMLQSDTLDSETRQQLLWRSRVLFPNTNKDNTDKAKDKHNGLFRKTASGNALAAGAAPDEVNRYLSWQGDVQSRSYALHHSEAYINIQAVLAGFNKDSWKQNHHLGRAAVVVNESWYYALLPGLFATAELSDLSVRRQELKNTLLNLVEAYWQALPIKVLKCDLNVVAGLPRVQEVMQTDEYASFSNRVLQAECDSMEKLQMMQEVPYLAEWQQANCARQESQQATHHASSISTDFSRAREQSQLRSTEAAEIVSQEPPAKRQKIAHSAADKEQQMEAELEQLRSERRQTELQLHIDTEKQAMLELCQQQEILRTRQLILNAQGNSAQVMSTSTSNQDVQPSITPFTPELQAQTVLSCSSAGENS